MAKYDPLKTYLSALKGTSCALTFDAIEAIIDAPLTQSATEYREWWSNETPSPTSHVQALSWMDAGWRVDTVRLHAKQVPASPGPRSKLTSLSETSGSSAHGGSR